LPKAIGNHDGSEFRHEIEQTAAQAGNKITTVIVAGPTAVKVLQTMPVYAIPRQIGQPESGARAAALDGALVYVTSRP